MRWLVVMQFDQPGLIGVDFANELRGLGHEVRRFAYRRSNPLYKNRSTKAAYQLWILRRLERLCLAWRPAVVLVMKGGAISPGVIARIKRRTDAIFVNVFPDNPLWMMGLDALAAYDVFFTKEPYALRALASAGFTNVHYLPLYCVPADHHPVALTSAERARYGSPISFVGSRYPYREHFVRSLAHYPLTVWGPGWSHAEDPALRALARPPVFGEEKLRVYAASTLSLNHHHPMNDIAGLNNRVFELAGAGACQVVDHKEDLPGLFKPGEEVLVYRDRRELRDLLDYYLAHPDEARAVGENARRRALAEHTVRHRLDEIVSLLEQRFGLPARPPSAP